MRRPLLLLLYGIVMWYAFMLAPGSLKDVSQILAVTKGASDEANPFFRALFTVLLGVGVGMFAVLSAGAPAQTALSVELFGVLGSLLGFYGSGAYIALRTYSPVPPRPTELRKCSWLIRVMEWRLVGLFVLAYCLRAYSRLFPMHGGGHVGFSECWADFVHLLQTDRYVCASALDIVVLTFVGADIIAEDMKRRGWRFHGASATKSCATNALIVSVPGIGLGAYLLMRPKLGKA